MVLMHHRGQEDLVVAAIRVLIVRVLKTGIAAPAYTLLGAERVKAVIEKGLGPVQVK